MNGRIDARLVQKGVSERETGDAMTQRVQSGETSGYLDGQLLIAMPGIGDERFAGTVIYMCAHSSDGAMGLVLNQRSASVEFADLLVQLKIIAEGDRDTLPALARDMTVRQGGPVESGRGFVLHS